MVRITRTRTLLLNEVQTNSAIAQAEAQSTAGGAQPVRERGVVPGAGEHVLRGADERVVQNGGGLLGPVQQRTGLRGIQAADL